MEELVKNVTIYVEKNPLHVFYTSLSIIVIQFLMIIYFCFSSKTTNIKEDKIKEGRNRNSNSNNITNLHTFNYTENNKSSKNDKDINEDKNIIEKDDEESVYEERENSFKMKLKEEEERMTKHNKNVIKKMAKRDRKARSEDINDEFKVVKNGKY